MSNNKPIQEGSSESEETVVVSKLELSALMDRIAKLETGDTRVKAERPKFHTSKVWFVDVDKTEPVIGYGKNKIERALDGKEILFAEFIYRDKKDEVKSKWLPLVDFRASDNYLEGKVLQVKKDFKTVSNGYTSVKNVDYDKYRTIDTEVEVPLEVIIPNDTYVIELSDGRTLEIPENALN